MEYLLTSQQMKSADNYTIRELGIPSNVLMERAASACVNYIEKESWSTDNICIVCGSGNNGGDGFAIGRLLLERGIQSTVLFVGKAESCTNETKYQIELFRQCGGDYITNIPNIKPSVVIDAIFGVGLNREISGSYKETLEWMNQLPGHKLAVDIPSGIDASTGNILGCVFNADVTITFQEKKIGLMLYPAANYVGKIVVEDIGIDSSIVTKNIGAAYTLNTQDIKKSLPVRNPDSNKGTYGKALVIAGSKGMAGAAYLCAHAAYMAGAGLVRIYTVEENRIPLQILLPEAIITPYDSFDEEEVLSLLEWSDTVCIGPGIGMSDLSKKILETVVKNISVPCLIDADGLNLLSENTDLMEHLSNNPFILTPHMKELSRLTGTSIETIKSNRKEFAEQFTNQFPVILVEKDARTIVSQKGKQTYLNLTGNAAMAKGGSGDVLSGVICGLLAQKMDCFESAVTGVYLHGASGDYSRKVSGDYSVLARDLINNISCVLKRIA